MRGNNLLALCKGEDDRVQGISCPYYTDARAECRLLRTQQMDAFWEQCRYQTLELVYDLAPICSRKLKQVYRNLPVDETENVDIAKIVTLLRGKKLEKMPTLPGWAGYVRKTVYREMKRILAQQQFIPERKQCGTCKHFSATKPQFCLKNGARRNKTDAPCKDYDPEVVEFQSLDDDSCNLAGLAVPEAMRALSDNWVSKTPEEILLAKEADQQMSLPALLEALLRQRATSEKPASKRRSQYERQYELFLNLRHLLAQGISTGAIETILAEKYHIKERTIRRDLATLRKFFRKIMSAPR